MVKKLAILMFLLVVPSVMADSIQVGDVIELSDAYPASRDDGTSWWGGGMFWVTDVNNPADTFWTVCLEELEDVALNGTDYLVWDVSDQAYLGGGGPNPDPISEETAYLFYMARVAPSVIGFDFNDAQSQQDLQNAIWYFEDEISLPASNPFIDLALKNANEEYLNLVSVINPIEMPSQIVTAAAEQRIIHRQSILQTVPEPGSLILLGTGLLGLAAFSRRFKK